MDLGSAIADSTGRERLHVLTTEYTTVSGGRKVDEPIIHLVCRNEACEREIIEVEGYRPSFYISEAEFADRVEEVATERRVLAIEVPADPVQSATDDALSTYDHVFGATDTVTTLHDEPLVRLYCRVPGDVPELRDAFEKTWEADVPFTDRFLIDSEISTGVSIPEGAKRVRYENWPGHSESAGYKQEIEPAEKPDAPPRVLNCDIEVATEGQGMPNPARAAQPITTICAYDSYADEYCGWVQASPEWADQEGITVDNTLHTQFEEHIDEQLGRDVEMFAFTEEREMLDHFVEWAAEREFDLYTGWNSGGFDYPYIIKRAYNTSNYHIEDWSPFGEMKVWPQGEDSVGFRMKGLVPFDMLSGYKKTIWSEPRNYKLETISAVELGSDQAKLEVDSFDDAWHYHPFEFMAYNVRDVEAVEGIEQVRGVLDLFDNIRAVAGCDYEQAHHNINLIDVLFLRKAARQHLALPTNTVPEEGNYHGALVVDPKPGYSPTAIYPDLASMYPSILWTLNISPETFFSDEESLRAAGYTPEDAFTAYIDKRGFKVVPKSEDVVDVDWDQYKGVVDTNDNLRNPPGMDDPRYDEVYYLKPDIKEGFVRDTIDDLVGLKYEFKGTDLYAAVKRVTNSVYGVLGDSDSHNKGFRLFQAELAETVTLVGRKLLRFTADAYVEHINEAHPEANVEIVGGDTDSVVNSVPGAPDYKTALEWSQEASEAFQPDEEGNPGYYDEFASEEFDIVYGEDEHRFDVEIESVASGIFFVRNFDDDDPDKAVKKRYAQDIVWEDDVEDEGVRKMPGEGAAGTWLLTPEEMQSQGITPGVDAWKPTPLEDRIGIKGFEVVRSDVSTLCTRSQEEVFRLILDSPDRDPIEEYVADQVEKTKAGEIPNAWIGRPKGMSKDLDEYGRHDDGTPRSKPAPAYRGAKYADVWLDHEDILPGSKPIRFYVDRVDPTSDYPEVYTYERDGTTHYPQDSLEIDDPVDAISVEEPDRIPEAFELDWEKMCEKELQGPLEPICRTVGLEWEDIVSEGTQSSLADW